MPLWPHRSVESRMRVLPNHADGERPALFLNGREGALTCAGMPDACSLLVSARRAAAPVPQQAQGRTALAYCYGVHSSAPALYACVDGCSCSGAYKAAVSYPQT